VPTAPTETSPLSSLADIRDLSTVDVVSAFVNPALGPVDKASGIAQILVTGVSTWIANSLNRDLYANAWSEQRHGNGMMAMKTKRWPIISVQSVQIQSTPGNILRTIASTQITFDTWFIYLLNERYPPGVQNIVLNYTAGFNTPGQVQLNETIDGADDLPADFRLACLRLVQLCNKDRGRLGDTGTGIGPEHVSYMLDAMDKRSVDVLKNLREVVPYQ